MSFVLATPSRPCKKSPRLREIYAPVLRRSLEDRATKAIEIAELKESLNAAANAQTRKKLAGQLQRTQKFAADVDRRLNSLGELCVAGDSSLREIAEKSGGTITLFETLKR